MVQAYSANSAQSAHNLTIPSWSEPAVLVRSSPSGERRIIAEGSLDMVVKALAAHGPRSAGLSISLPDRQIAPFVYGPETLPDLVLVWTISRSAQSRPRRAPIVE